MAGNTLERLTERERRALELIADAATNQEICERLGISLWTVKAHTGTIYGKLGVKSRAQCVKLVRELGLAEVVSAGGSAVGELETARLSRSVRAFTHAECARPIERLTEQCPIR